MQRTLKQREMMIIGITAEQWETERREADAARARIRAEYAVEYIIQEELEHVVQGALYHAGKLTIGCVTRPPIRTGHRGGRENEVWGKLPSIADAEARQAFGSPNW